MTLILHTEAPSLEDIIDGNSHQNIANQIAAALALDDINIIGIDGPLGSGKSTVIKLLEKDLASDEFQFINFDAEIYQQGSTKKALITKIFDGILPKTPSSLKGKLQEYKDEALGNNITYRKTQDSAISSWSVIFIASLFICSQSIRPMHAEWSKLPEEINHLLGWVLVALVASPIVIVLCFLFASTRNKSLKIGNLIKRNTVDIITEKMLISKEVGSIELHKAISGFKECIPPGLKFLLIIDNLDRISPEKVKEIWSDIELISNSSEKRLKLIIPYSSEHVAKSLSSDPYEGKEYISKRIPISFQIPPILSAGWRNVFSNYWKTSFPHDTENLHHDTSELIEIWLPKSYQPVTPRYLKKLINDIQIISSSTPFPVKNIVCAYYILTTRQNETPFNHLLIENFESNTIEEQSKDKFKKSIRKLQRIYGNNRQQWIDELLCINYQTSASLAQGELIDEPLKIALIQADADELSKISDMFGFLSAWRKIIDTTDPTDWFVTLSKMSNEKNEIVKEILPEVIKSLDTLDDTPTSTIENENFLPSIITLKENGFEIHGQYIEKITSKISDEILNYVSLDDNSLLNLGMHSSEIQLSLLRCELISKLIEKNILKEVYPLPTSVFYILNLKDKSNDFPNLEISSYRLKADDLIYGLRYSFMNGINIRLTESDIDKHAILQNPAVLDVIQNTPTEGLDVVYSNFVNSSTVSSLLSFELLVLYPSWHTTNLTPYYTRLFASAIDWKNECIAHFIAQMIASQTISSIEMYKNNISDTNIFTNNLSCYLKYIPEFSKITSALTLEILNEYLTPALDVLCEQKSLQINNVDDIIKKSFSTLNKYLGHKFIEQFTKDNENLLSERIEAEWIKNIDSSLIDFIINKEEPDQLSNSLIYSFESEIETQDDFNKVSKESLGVHSKIVSYAFNNGYNLSLIKDFITPFYNDFNVELLDTKMPRMMFDTLNDDDKSITLRNLSDLIYMRGIDVKRQILLLKHFNDILIYNDEDESTRSGSRSITRLFDHIESYPFIVSWLDIQNINFNKWNHDDKRHVVEIIANNVLQFPTLGEKNPVKTKLRELKSQEE
ncbi:hypothetical protein GCM10011328_30730 [Hafnia psychrotolerans]|uniref:KAP NTPase domain-containing protein n=2 Tax=Hafnia psychrotolerans TaxID=1477018 RepID=A0ABQ1GYG8_9GAMM|nr:hypothetical protein GCM10011328_30730 [Hafnia psychrotolerans]